MYFCIISSFNCLGKFTFFWNYNDFLIYLCDFLIMTHPTSIMKSFLFFLFMYVYVYDICACLCMGVCTYLCMSIDQRRMFNALMYYSPLYCFKTGSVSEQGVRLVASKFQWSSFLHPHSTGVTNVMCYAWLFMWMLRSELGCLYLHSKRSYHRVVFLDCPFPKIRNSF